MISLRRFLPITLILVVALLVAACGGSTTSNNPAPTATTPPTTAPTTAPTTTPTTAPSALIQTAMATVGGKTETILTNAQGMTLYYRTSDSPPATVCSGGCAGAWPPLVISGSSVPTSAASLSGKLTIVSDANGNQVEYNGHPLYTYSRDTAAGQTTGEGVGGVWHVCTP